MTFTGPTRRNRATMLHHRQASRPFSSARSRPRRVPASDAPHARRNQPKYRNKRRNRPRISSARGRRTGLVTLCISSARRASSQLRSWPSRLLSKPSWYVGAKHQCVQSCLEPSRCTSYRSRVARHMCSTIHELVVWGSGREPVQQLVAPAG